MIFTIHLITSFFVGGLLISLQTIIGERVSLFWRGIVLTIPTTLPIGLLFIGLVKTPQDVAQAAIIIPAGLATSYIYITVFSIFSKFGLIPAIFGSLSIWGLLAFFLLNFPPADFLNSLLIYCLPFILFLYLIIQKLPQIPSLKSAPITFNYIFIRSLIGGFIIALAVLLSKLLGNIWGGLFSVFPAAFSSTLIIYYLANGKSVIPSVAKSLFFPGVIGFIIYSWIVLITFPPFGIWIGTFLSYTAVFLFFLIYTSIQKFIKV